MIAPERDNEAQPQILLHLPSSTYLPTVDDRREGSVADSPISIPMDSGPARTERDFSFFVGKTRVRTQTFDRTQAHAARMQADANATLLDFEDGGLAVIRRDRRPMARA